MLFAPIIILVIAVIACAAPAYVAVRTEPASALREQ
jgi:ABC-type lipoprotein release transport system permease subunit